MTEITSADPAETEIIRWLTANLGPVSDLRRQNRWRPCWFADVQTKDGMQTVFVRGTRGGIWPPQPLIYEYKVHKAFEENGIKVPKLIGWIESLPAMVMESVRGRQDVRFAESEEAFRTLRDQLVDQMVLMHSLDPQIMRDAGAVEATTSQDLAISYYQQVNDLYLSKKQRPEPILEFFRLWLFRNAPEGPEVPEVVAIDAGQFMYEGHKLTAMIDFEMAALGDRYTDLGALRTRDRVEYLGDLNELYAIYEQKSGMKLDVNRIRWHGIAVSTLTPLMSVSEMVAPIPGQDHYTRVMWWAVNLKDACDELAERLGVELPLLPEPEPGPGTRYSAALEALEQGIMETPEPDQYDHYNKERLRLVAQFTQRVDRYQRQFDEDYLDDIEELTGYRPSDWMEADAFMESFVVQAKPELDVPLLALFYRQIQRHFFLGEDPANPHARRRSRIPALLPPVVPA